MKLWVARNGPWKWAYQSITKKRSTWIFQFFYHFSVFFHNFWFPSTSLRNRTKYKGNAWFYKGNVSKWVNITQKITLSKNHGNPKQFKISKSTFFLLCLENHESTVHFPAHRPPKSEMVWPFSPQAFFEEENTYYSIWYFHCSGRFGGLADNQICPKHRKSWFWQAKISIGGVKRQKFPPAAG